MTLPRTGSRRIAIDGETYVWRIRKAPTYSQGLGSPMTLAVQRDGGRSVLVVDLGISRPDNWLAPHQTAVTPQIVRTVVRRALAEGWVPEGDEGRSLHHQLIQDA